MPLGIRCFLAAFCALVCGILLCQPSFAGEREDAVAFLATTLKCPVPNERQTDSWGMFHLIKTHNEYTGNQRTFRLREHYTETMGKTGAEMYQIKNYNDVAINFNEISSVSPTGTKAVIRCRSGRNCIDIHYVHNVEGATDGGGPTDCWEEGMCRQESRKAKTSYRVSTCSKQAARDVKDAVEFLAGMGGGK